MRRYRRKLQPNNLARIAHPQSAPLASILLWGCQRGDLIRPTAAPANPRMTPGGIIPLWGARSSRNRGAASSRYEGRHHPGIGGRLPQESARRRLLSPFVLSLFGVGRRQSLYNSRVMNRRLPTSTESSRPSAMKAVVLVWLSQARARGGVDNRDELRRRPDPLADRGGPRKPYCARAPYRPHA